METQKILFIALFAIALFAIGGLYVTMSGSSAAEDEATKINVGGSATISTDPDEVAVYLKIETLYDDASTSQSENADIYEQVKAALLAQGVDEEDMKTTYYNLDLDEEWNWETNEYEEQGYKTIHKIKVISSDVDSAGELVDAAVDAGATVDYVTFQLSDEVREELEDQLLGEAVEDARNKAENMAGAAGMALGKLVSADYGTPTYYSSSYYGYELAAMSIADSSGTSLSSGSIEVSVAVTTSFEAN